MLFDTLPTTFIRILAAESPRIDSRLYRNDTTSVSTRRVQVPSQPAENALLSHATVTTLKK